ncbi:MAG: TonB-dependent receptor [Flavobacteriales bacterium]|nr:TonB-dependent receptor [Flavobacteriales bacterium]
MNTRIFSKVCGFMLFMPLLGFSQNNITGIVKGIDGSRISGVEVEIQQTYFKTYTDLEGAFEFGKLDAGSYKLNFSSIGFVPVSQSVEIENADQEFTVVLSKQAQLLEEVTVSAIRANPKIPTTYSEIEVEEIEENNFGQDLPYILNALPSTVVTSDAGAGVGYSGVRIRGVDPTRTNVTINGVPLNDSESHGVYWVNMPDFASSLSSIQVQRGVGTSSNGAAAFGASINMETNSLNKEAYGILDNSFGSFNTFKNTVKVGTGLLNDKFIIDARLSAIQSDGYIDRSASELKSYYLSGVWLGSKSNLRATLFSGKEKTAQAWYGTPESVINGDKDQIAAYADRNYIFGSDRENLLNSGRTYNYYTYDNEIDNYQQDHYQLHFNHVIDNNLKFSTAAHYTRGRGYYEQYKAGEDFSDYGFAPIVFQDTTINKTDLIRRKWLDNHFYGGIFSLAYAKNGLDLTFGGGANQYEGGHFGEVIWSEYSSDSKIRDRYYDNDAQKQEAHTYLKGTYKTGPLTVYGDFQYRYIDYTFLGIDEVAGKVKDVQQTKTFNFLNPKFGLMYDFDERNNAYASVAVANREPVRKDFRESTPQNQPKVENLVNLEAGYRFKGQDLIVNANVYYMHYKDQLVLTGQINDVGEYTRRNVDVSYRSGIELETGYRLTNQLSLMANASLSRNKIKEFNEFVDNYDNEDGSQDTIAHKNTDLAFSPNIVANLGLTYEPLEDLSINLSGKHIGGQYLDNTSTETQKLNAYTTLNLQLKYTLKEVLFEEVSFGLLVNNLLDESYESNGYTWGYIYGEVRTVENFYYPQAGRNFLARVVFKL